MTDDKSESASEKTKSLQSAPSVASKSLPSISSQEASQTKQDHALRSSGAELEDYQSPKIRTRSLIKPAKRDSRQSSKGQTSTPNKNADAWQGESPSSICLCQPDPKVPRPRNAFILYRQHHQASVVAQNPGLANPEISKVIGDHWRTSPGDVKEHWKLLAEEEKLRHQKQYPDYRYQPRRSGRNNSLSNSAPSAESSESEPRRCPKCGGKSISSSRMMSGAGFSAQNTPNKPYAPSQPLSTPSSSSSAGRFLRGLGSPPIGVSPPGYRTRPSTAHSPPMALSSPRFKRPESGDNIPYSPESKRRRMNNVTYAPIRGPNGPQTPFAFPHQHQRRQSLPRPDFMGPGVHSPFAMGPPPRPGHTQAESPITLAPLHTAHNPNHSVDTQAKSLEAMILSIPTLNKIRVLAKISPPLSPPSPNSPAYQTRGLVIAIDAADPTSVKQLTATLSSSLSNYPFRVFTTPQTPQDEPETFQSYLRLVEAYHTLSSQVTNYITTLPSTRSPSPEPVSPKSFPSPKPFKPFSSSTMPIAIVPSWQLTNTDTFACSVDISDRYSPMDHWQWGATLWRGVIGADVTVAVRVEGGEDSPGSREGEGGGKKGKDAGKGVEVRLEDARAILVRGEREGLGEGGLRRVGFEVSEWVRGLEAGAGGRRGS